MLVLFAIPIALGIIVIGAVLKFLVWDLWFGS